MKENIAIYESGQDMMICELDKLVQKNEVSPTTLEYIDKIVDIIKDLDEIITNEEMKYDSRNSGRSYAMNSYASNNYGRGSSYRSRGYSNYNNNYNTSNSGRSDKTYEMLDHLYAAHDSASSEEERKRIKRMIEEIENSK